MKRMVQRAPWMIAALLALASPATAQWGLPGQPYCCTKPPEQMVANPKWTPGSKLPALVPFGSIKLQLHDSIRVHLVGTWSNGVKLVSTPMVNGVPGTVRVAALLLLLPSPTSATVGVAIKPGPTIQILNPEGLPIAAPGITVAVSSKGAKLAGTVTALTNIQGRVTFPSLILMDTARTVLTFYVPATPTMHVATSQPIRVTAITKKRVS